jgi:hypothetical protein
MNQPEIQHIPLESSLLASAAYSDATLELLFRNGQIYRYLAVPPEVFQALLAAPSKGAFFNQSIRDRFTFQRLD